jgi:hypothetical protein
LCSACGWTSDSLASSLARGYGHANSCGTADVDLPINGAVGEKIRRSIGKIVVVFSKYVALQLVDFWRFTEFRDPRLWAGDRIHLSPLGHERMAAKFLTH